MQFFCVPTHLMQIYQVTAPVVGDKILKKGQFLTLVRLSPFNMISAPSSDNPRYILLR